MPGPHHQGWSRVIICASGPSFTVEQMALVNAAQASGRWRVLAINATAFTLPNADAMYAADTSFCIAHGDKLRSFAGQKWTRSEEAAKRFGMRLIRIARGEGLSRDLGVVNTLGNSGATGIGLSYLFGMRFGLAVGLDMKLAADGRAHHHGDHGSYVDAKGVTRTLANPSPDALEKWRKQLSWLARDLNRAGIQFVNCSPGANTAFASGDLAETIERFSEEVAA